jgi:hypothetical protein
VLGGRSFAALAESLQNALWALGDDTAATAYWQRSAHRVPRGNPRQWTWPRWSN